MFIAIFFADVPTASVSNIVCGDVTPMTMFDFAPLMDDADLGSGTPTADRLSLRGSQ